MPILAPCHTCQSRISGTPDEGFGDALNCVLKACAKVDLILGEYRGGSGKPGHGEAIAYRFTTITLIASNLREMLLGISKLLEKESMKIRPLRDRVIVRRVEEETTSTGGIVLPGSATEKPNQGVVVAVGDGVFLDNGDKRPLGVGVGDKVIFGKYADSNTVKLDGEELIILSESDISAILLEG